MKRIYLIGLILLSFTFSCTENFEDFNTDKKNPTAVQGEYLFAQGQLELADQIASTNVNLNIWKLVAQYWTETTYNDESNYDIISRNIPEQKFRAYYRYVLNTLTEAGRLIEVSEVKAPETEASKQNKLMIIELLKVYTYHNLVNIFGDVPYTEALDFNNISPKYDDAFTIYKDLLARIDATYPKLDASSHSFGSADFIYGGDVAMWKVFAQSLKLKIAINLADFDNALAKTNVEAAVNAGVISSQAQSAHFVYSPATPYNNPLYDDLVLSGRQDFIPANTLVDAMVNLEDPRIGFYFQDQVDGAWVGGVYGATNVPANFSHINASIEVADFPGFFITYTEVQFYLAEAAARGYSVGQSPEEAYNEAITSSILFWGGDQDAVDAYLENEDVAYTTAGTWQEAIGMQSWIANYTRGLVSYNTYRRLDYPAMNVAPTPATDDGSIPTRFTYPVNEQTLNATNYEAAATAIGGDKLTTKLFWDIN